MVIARVHFVNEPNAAEVHCDCTSKEEDQTRAMNIEQIVFSDFGKTHNACDVIEFNDFDPLST